MKKFTNFNFHFILFFIDLIIIMLNLLFINLALVSSILFFSIKFFILIVIALLIINLFAYFFTIYQHSKYTTFLRFYWLRVFFLIWFLEFYLFAIFLFLYIIAPNELTLFWDFFNYLKFNFPNFSIRNNFLFVYFLVMTFFFFPFLNYYNMTLRFFFYIIFILINLNFFFIEFKSYMVYLSISNYKKMSIIETETESNVSFKTLFYDRRIQIPSIYILNIILGVKFIHLYFIIIISFIFIMNSIKKCLSLTLIGVLHQNTVILAIFWILNYLIYFKKLYKWQMYGFYPSILLERVFVNRNWYVYEWLHI